jgi:group I intron endonuclease
MLLLILILVLTIPLASQYLLTILFRIAFLIFLPGALLSKIFGELFQSTLFLQSPLSIMGSLLYQEELNLLFLSMPIIIYSNADTAKSSILSENKGKAGIYQWTHNESGKRYIGSAFDLSKRLKDYYSTYYLNRASSYICKAIICHTHSAFSLSILEYIDVSPARAIIAAQPDNSSKKEIHKLILEREQYYLDLIFSVEEPNTYNLLKEAGSRLGSKHSPETITKISGENNSFFGKTHSAETVAKMRKIQRSINRTGKNNPMYGKSLSISTKALMSKAKIGENNPASKSVYLYSIDPVTKNLTLINFFNTCSDTAKYLNFSIRTLSNYLDKNKLYKNQWILSTSLISTFPASLRGGKE